MTDAVGGLVISCYRTPNNKITSLPHHMSLMLVESCAGLLVAMLVEAACKPSTEEITNDDASTSYCDGK